MQRIELHGDILCQPYAPKGTKRKDKVILQPLTGFLKLTKHTITITNENAKIYLKRKH